MRCRNPPGTFHEPSRPEPTEEELRALEAEADATYNCVLCGTGELTREEPERTREDPRVAERSRESFPPASTAARAEISLSPSLGGGRGVHSEMTISPYLATSRPRRADELILSPHISPYLATSRPRRAGRAHLALRLLRPRPPHILSRAAAQRHPRGGLVLPRLRAHRRPAGAVGRAGGPSLSRSLPGAFLGAF